MKKPFLMIAAAIALVVIPSIAVWQLSGDDSRRQGALGDREPVALSWRGDWIADAEYATGNVVSHEGSSFVAEGEKLSTPEPDCAECGWRRIASAISSTAPSPAPTTLTSPNGNFKLEVKDTGILLSGPTASVLLAADRLVVNTSKDVDLTVGTALGIRAGSNVLVNAGSNIAAKASGNLSLESAGTGFVKSPVLTLGCSGGGKAVARLGDRVNVGGGGYAGSAAPGLYPIAEGSPNVLAC